MSGKSLLLQSSALICICIFFVGCSQTPIPISHKLGTQKKIQAIQHWKIIAQDIGKDIVESIKQDKIDKSVRIIPNNNSSFCQAFRSYLSTYLINSGINIDQGKNNVYQLYWSVQQVTHQGYRKSSSFIGSNTFVTALGYGIYKVFSDSTTAAKFLAVGAGADALIENYKDNNFELPKNEIIINVSMYKFDSVHYRKSNAYYLNDLDTGHYYFTKDNIDIKNKFKAKTYYISN